MPSAVRYLLIAATCHSLLGWGMGTPTACGQNQRLQMSISVRTKSAEEPRFVVAFRITEEGETAQPEFETPAAIVDFFTKSAEVVIADMDQLCQIDDKQHAKLKLAALGDMSRLIREARQVHQKYNGTSPHNQVEMLAASAAVSGINANLSQGVLRSDSIFRRVLANTLSPEQITRLATARITKQINAWSLKLTDEQREQLVDQMIAHSQRLPDPIILWEPPQCVALIRDLDRGELEKFLEPSQIASIGRLH